MSTIFRLWARSVKASNLSAIEASVFHQPGVAVDEVNGAEEALCWPVLRLGLSFADHAPKAWMMCLLKDHGFASPEALKSRLDLPNQPLMVRPWSVHSSTDMPLDSPSALSGVAPASKTRPNDAGLLDVTLADPWDVLFQAVILGLCSAHRYDPKRPVIWTNTSLSRQLLCFPVGGFYQ